MKKLTFFTLTIIILFTGQQAYAVPNIANGKATSNPSVDKRNENSIRVEDVNEEDDAVVSPQVEEEEENEEKEWKNHGQYVSSVAKTNPGGGVVSEAARSYIGKKNSGSAPETIPSVSPSPTDDPELILSPSPTDAPIPTPSEEVGGQNTVSSIIDAIEGLINTLRGLLNL